MDIIKNSTAVFWNVTALCLLQLTKRGNFVTSSTEKLLLIQKSPLSAAMDYLRGKITTHMALAMSFT
jgi:hypothetical protein